MKRFICGCAIVVIVAPALADVAEYNLGDLQVASEWQMGVAKDIAGTRAATDPYENTTTFSGFQLSNGGATAGNPNGAVGAGTRMVADDINIAFGGGAQVTRLDFCIGNLNSVGRAVRPRLRFWFTDGAGGNPGTYYNQSTGPVTNSAIGFSFNPIQMANNAATCFFTNFTLGAPNSFVLPTGGSMWAGIMFDNNNGNAGGVPGVTMASVAELNNFGVLLFNPPVAGTSDANKVWTSNAAGSFFGTANPAGTSGAVGGGAPSNVGWRFVPEPSTLALLGLGGFVLTLRKRK